MLTDSLFALKTEDELRRSSKDILDFLQKTSKLRFWRAHFANHNFVFDKKKFNWDYWKTIPYLSIEELIKIGIEPRLEDAESILKINPYRLVLRILNRKMYQQNLLFIDIIPKLLGDDKEKQWKIQLTESFEINLRHVLLSLRAHGRKHHVVIINPQRLDQRMKKVFYELRFDSLSTDPQNLQKFLDIFDSKDSKKLYTQIKKVTLTQSFKDRSQEQVTKEIFGKADFMIQHPLVRITIVVRSCVYVQRHHGADAFHPGKYALIELRDVDENGYGEIIATTMMPVEVAWIRYRTGFFGRAIFEECECGSKWSLILKRIRKFHYSLPVQNRTS